MPSAGEVLRQERLNQKRTLSELASQTCINRRYLEALEADDAAALPGPFFHRSFVKQYAKALGLDDRTVDDILPAAPVPEEIDPLPALTEAYKPETLKEGGRWGFLSSRSGAFLLLILVLAGCSAIYAVWSRSQQQAGTEGLSSQEPLTAEPAPQTEVHAAAELPPTTIPAPVEPPPAPAQTPAPQKTAAPGGYTVTVSATEPTWVSLSSGGHSLYAGTLQPQDSRSFEVSEEARLRTGNAGALELRWNGIPVGPIGPRGHVRNVLLTAHGAQVMAPRPVED
jgi:cytoskeletal protein RodZ